MVAILSSSSAGPYTPDMPIQPSATGKVDCVPSFLVVMLAAPWVIVVRIAPWFLSASRHPFALYLPRGNHEAAVAQGSLDARGAGARRRQVDAPGHRGAGGERR